MKYIYLSGVVDPWYEINQKSVEDLVTSARAEDPSAEITVVLNSPGGDVAEGMAIYNYLRRAKVNTEISGMAASIASVIALAGQHVAIYDNSTFFIHHAWCFLDGNAEDARIAADRMDAVDANLAAVYAARGLSSETIAKLMDGPDGKGSLITAAQALELGLVDEVLDPAKAVAACMKSFSHPRNTTTNPNKEDPAMAADPEPTVVEPAVEPQAACGEPPKAEKPVAEPIKEDDTPSEEVTELMKEVEELKKEIEALKAKNQQAASLKQSVAQAHAKAQADTDADLDFPELVKKIGYANARMKYPDKMSAYCEAELAKGSIRD